ncbi:MAG: translesion error-prone DNA polymerase V autoproteolytic subunit [Patescibacteria group bacterium]
MLAKTIPFFTTQVQAGFPSQADDYLEKNIDINDLFQVDEATSFYVRAVGMSMKNSGIMPGDILHVRRDLDARDGDIVIAVIDSEFTVKTFRKKGSCIIFEASNEEFPDIIPESEQDVQIWGVVTGFARILRK